MNMCPKGVITVGLDKSLLNPAIQAKVCRPSQFTAQEPQIPSLHDLIKISQLNP